MNELTRESIDRIVGKICDVIEIAVMIAFLPLLAFFIYITLNTPVQ
ncbi:MAG: hypothetical protein IKF72_02910 [Kiritimatiellae bacterium]|nr:hypothetical protein [Kiritimatiellia bacterium]